MDESLPRRLTRSRDRMIGGVAAGVAEYFELDPTIARVLFVLAFFANGIGLVAYLVMWILIPGATPGERLPTSGGPAAQAAGVSARGRGGDSVPLLLGVVLVGIGVLLLFNEFALVNLGFALVRVFWPALLIAAGAALIFTRRGAATR